MHYGCIVVKKPNELLPQELVDKIAHNYNTVRGVAVPNEGQIEVLTESDAPSWAWVNGIQEEYQADPMLFYFGKFDGGYLEEDIQPFSVIRNAEGKAILVCALEGDLDNFAQEKSTHSHEFFAVHTHILPKLNKLFASKDVEENMAKFIQELKDPVVRSELSRLGVGDSCLIMMTPDGDIHRFASDAYEQNDEYSFGWASDYAGYGVPLEEEKKEEPPQGKLDKLAKLKAATAALPKKEEAPAPKKEDLKSSTAPVKEVPVTGKPPDNCKTKGQVKQWYRNNNAEIDPRTGVGAVPEGYSSRRPAVTLRNPNQPVKSLQEMGEKLKEKQEEPKKEEAVPPPPSEAPSLPIIPKEEKDLIQIMLDKDGDITRLLDVSSKKVMEDPEKVQELEKKHPSFTEQIGKAEEGLDTLTCWPLEAFEQLVENAPKAAAILLFNLRNDRLIIQSKLPAKKEPPAESRVDKLAKLKAAVGG